MRRALRPIAFLTGIALIAFLGVMLVSGVVGLTAGLPAAKFIYPHSPGTIAIAVVNFLFVIGIPVTMLILAIMRVFMRSNFKPRWQFGLWAFWFLNVVGAFAIGTFTVKQFSHATPSPISMGTLPAAIGSDTLFVDMGPSPARDAIFQFGDNTCISDGQLYNGHIHLNFKRSKTGEFAIELMVDSRGKSIKEAAELAGKVQYEYRLEGNRLVLPSYFVIPKGEKWRGQNVEVNIFVPDGKYVRRGNRTAHFTYHVDRDRDHRFEHWNNKYIWQMTPKGMVAPGLVEENRERYNFSDFSKIRTEGQVELRLRQGDEFKIKITDGGRSTDRLKISQSGERLTLRGEGGHRFSMDITMPELTELWLIESRDVEIRDFNLQKLRIVNEGRGDIDIFADIDSLSVELSQHNELDIRGKGNYLKAFLSENATLEAEHFEARNASIDMQPSTRAYVSVSDTLRQHVDGDERRLKLRGKPIILDLDGNLKEVPAEEEN